jgi:hypothetical protein
MMETEFGPGSGIWVSAETPSLPILSQDAADSIDVTIGEDANGPLIEYAIANLTDGVFLDGEGGASPTRVWRTREEWGTIRLTGLEAFAEYTFLVRARSGDLAESEDGPSAAFTVRGILTDELSFSWEVKKASSTISAPSFMSGLGEGIRLAGKNLIDFGFVVDRIGGLDLPKVQQDEELVPGDHTWRVHGEYFTPKRIVLEGYIHGDSPDDLRLRIAYLKSFLATFEGNPWRSRTPVTLERSDMGDRHWRVFYESIDQMETIGKRTLASSARVRVAMKCPSPFAFSNEVARVVFTPGAGSFRHLEIGNAPSDGVFVMRGPATDPAFALGDMMFHCNFEDGLAFTDAENAPGTGTFDPAENEGYAYRTTEAGLGILVAGDDTVSFTAPGNPSDSSWVIVAEPQWDSTEREGNAVLFEHRADENNFIRLSWDTSAHAWVFLKRAGGVEDTVTSPAQTFAAGTRIVLGITHDSANAGGMKLYVDGEQVGVGGSITVLQGAPQTVTLQSGDGGSQPDAIIDLLAGWSRMLSSDEMLRIAADPSTIQNHNTAVSYSGTLDEGDLLMLSSETRSSDLLDVSEGERVNALDSVSGEIPVLAPGRRRTASDRTQTVIYCRTAAAGMEVRYRRRYL